MLSCAGALACELLQLLLFHFLDVDVLGGLLLLAEHLAAGGAEPASASGTTVVVAEKPEEPEVGAVSDGGDGAVEATVVEAPVSSPVEAPEESGGEDDILSKLDIEVTPTYVLFGGGALIALLILSKIVAAIDSVPLLPKVLELVGTGYSIWFTAKYLLFKESRDELFAKFEDLKERII